MKIITPLWLLHLQITPEVLPPSTRERLQGRWLGQVQYASFAKKLHVTYDVHERQETLKNKEQILNKQLEIFLKFHIIFGLPKILAGVPASKF